MTGFEPATSCSQSRRSSQAELHPDPKGRESRYPREERQQAVSRENKLEDELWAICVNKNPILCLQVDPGYWRRDRSNEAGTQ